MLPQARNEAKPPRKINHQDFIKEAKEQVNKQEMGKPPKSRSKKRKYASQPRATKIKKGKKGTELPTL